MKMQIKIMLMTFIIIGGSFNKINSQSTTLGHFAPGFPVFNWCGWDAATPIPFNLEHRGTQDINFLTGGFQRMAIKGTGAGAFAGFVGIGTNFSTPQNLLHIHDGSNSYLQVTNGTTSNTATDGAKFGLFGNTPNTIIASQELNGNMYFATAGSGFPQIKMTILPNGNVGIGSGPPFIIGGITEKLDVDQGDIDVNTPQRSYMIGDQSVLWHKGSNENIFVGVGAGQTHGLNLASRNTYVVNRA